MYKTAYTRVKGVQQKVTSKAVKWKKALSEMQTLRAGWNKAEPKNFAPLQTPFPGRTTAKIKWATDGHYIHLQNQFGEDRCTQF